MWISPVLLPLPPTRISAPTPMPLLPILGSRPSTPQEVAVSDPTGSPHTKNLQAKIRGLKLSGGFAMGLGIPPLK